MVFLYKFIVNSSGLHLWVFPFFFQGQIDFHMLTKLSASENPLVTVNPYKDVKMSTEIFPEPI